MELKFAVGKQDMETAYASAEAIRKGTLSSSELIEASLDRIHRCEAVVGAWQYVASDAARREAARRDGEPPRGRLHGVPVGVKDVIDTAAMPTEYGSRIYSGYRPLTDAACVTRLQAEGGVVLGKTTTSEFALHAPAVTRNPWNITRTPGASSSGSAAAVSSGMVPLAIGTQMGGSVIRPAAYCGVVGFKPTFGLIDRTGVFPASSTLDTVGVFGREVRDVALLCRTLSGQRLQQALPRRHPPRIGLCRTQSWKSADPGAVETVLAACDRLAQAGSPVSEFDLPMEYEDLVVASEIIVEYEAARVLDNEYSTMKTELCSELRHFLERGRSHPSDLYWCALLRARQGRHSFREWLRGIDVILTLSSLGEAPIGTDTGSDLTPNGVWTLLQLPTLHLPIRMGPQGMPLGVQLVGKAGRDAAFLADAGWIESVLTDDQSREGPAV